MKKIILLSFLFCIGLISSAQHCPFDGSTVIVIKVVDKKGRPVTKLKQPFQLVEVDNPEADSCSFSAGLFQKDFLPSKKGIMNRYPGSWETWSQRFKDCSLFGSGCYALVLSMAEDKCMISQGNDYRYRLRNYMIRYTTRKNKTVQEIPVTEGNRYSLCTGAGSWCRIKPVTIVIE